MQITIKPIVPNDQLWQPFIGLYCSAFPENERRDINRLAEMTSTSKMMHVNAIMQNQLFVGLLVYWSFDSFNYLEHFAILPTHRGKGLGTAAIKELTTEKQFWLLEVEPDETELTHRRIQFYNRNGFQVLDRTYIQPAYNGNPNNQVPLWIMGNKQAHDVSKEIETIKSNVYGIQSAIAVL